MVLFLFIFSQESTAQTHVRDSSAVDISRDYPRRFNDFDTNIRLQIKQLPTEVGKIVNRFVQKDTLCSFSASRALFTEDSLHIYNDRITATNDGNLIIAGSKIRSYIPYQMLGYLVKCTPGGDTLWVKTLDPKMPTATMFCTNLFELKDGSLIIFSRIYVPLPLDYRYDLVMTKLTADGQFLWQRSFISPIGPGGDVNFEVSDLKEMPSGDLVIGGGIIISSVSRIGLIASFSPAGDLKWSKGLQDDLPLFTGLHIKGNSIHAYGRISSEKLGVVEMNIDDGTFLGGRGFRLNAIGSQALRDFFYPLGFTMLNNGNAVLYGRVNADILRGGGHWATLELTPQFDIANAVIYENGLTSEYRETRISVSPDGISRLLLSTYDNVSSKVMIYLGKVKNDSVYRERLMPFGSDHPHDFSNILGLSEGTDIVANTINQNGNNSLSSINLLMLNDADRSSDCSGLDTTLTTIRKVQWISEPLSLPVLDNALGVINHPDYLPQDDGMIVSPGCKVQSFCDSLEISFSADTLCVRQPLQLKVIRNPECGIKPVWGFNDAPLATVTFTGDSLCQAVFTRPWTGYVVAKLEGCSAAQDSVLVSITPESAMLDLGEDRVICSASSLVLRAGGGFAAYKWSNGSTDSTLNVSTAGKYYVNVTDFCGVVTSDTVVVAEENFNLDLGATKQKCNGDTLQLKAPAGTDFTYSWGPFYNISSTSTAEVTVFPMTDTSYYLTMTRSDGCVVKDTVDIIVQHSPPINLGSDTSICARDSLELSVSGNFSQYNWSTSASSSTIVVRAAGSYDVAAVSPNGCISRDTINLTNVWATPLPLLPAQSWLCRDSSLLLSPGQFAKYLWQDASVGNEFFADKTGQYWVKVEDIHGCQGSDTMNILTIRDNPEDFLVPAITWCPGDVLKISSTKEFESYRWNYPGTDRMISVSAPGNFVLTVKDQYGCSGIDSMIVEEGTDCTPFIFFPTAFTPNGDGKNDMFKPVSRGFIAAYKLSIFNRWGQMVFSSTDPARGWNGIWNGVLQDTSAFVWMCEYKLGNDSSLIRKKGTVTIIR